jgi:hypothetical protein
VFDVAPANGVAETGAASKSAAAAAPTIAVLNFLIVKPSCFNSDSSLTFEAASGCIKQMI